MYPEGGTTVVNKRMSFPSVLVLSLTAGFVTILVCVSGIAIYSLRMVDHKADSLTGIVERVLTNLPEYRKALPPMLADAIDDQRRPDYLKNVDVTVKMLPGEDTHLARGTVEVTNKSDEVISFLSLRIVGLDADGNPLVEQTTWAASPIAVDDNEWRGPILPRHTRVFPIRFFRTKGLVSFTPEITELRVWTGRTATAPAEQIPAESVKSPVKIQHEPV